MRPPPARPSLPRGGQSTFAKMKPQERALLILGVALLLISGYLFQGYRQALASKEKANKQFLAVARNVSNLQKEFDVAALQKKIEETNQALSGTENPWYKAYDSLDVDNLIINSALQSKIEMVKLTLGKESKQKIDNIDYVIELRQAQVKGELANIISFLGQIERGPLRTLRLNNFKITLAQGIWTGTLDFELRSLAEPGGSDVGRK